jgi:hypothetical protein
VPDISDRLSEFVHLRQYSYSRYLDSKLFQEAVLITGKRMRNSSLYSFCNAAILLLMLSSCNLSGAAPAFFAPAQSEGRISVKFYPMENVSPDSAVLVTFGVPFTRGSLTDSGLTSLRVLASDGSEIPAHVASLTPWRHLGNAKQNGRSVRVARIQLQYTFSVSYPDYETVTIEWGRIPRLKDIISFNNPRSAWHLVESGSFSAADSVYEPDVYAVLPKEYMCSGSLKPGRMLPLDNGITAEQEDPGAIDRISDWPGYLEMDHAQHNSFFTLVNEHATRVSPDNLCPYKSEYEPWLYDRSTAMFLLYLRGGHLRALREAVRHTQFYRNNLWDDNTSPSRFTGLFKLKVPEVKGHSTGNGAMYSYNECLAYNYWLTGDEEVLDEIEWIVNAHEMNDEPTRWDPSLGFWTERHTAFRLLANAVAFEVTGKAVYRDSMVSHYRNFIRHQDGAGGLLPADRVDGGLYHFSNQHGDGAPDKLIASSWMTVLTSVAMLRVYALTEDAAIADFIRRIGNFEKAACKLDDMPAYGDGPLWYCDYIVGYDGSSVVRTGHTVAHSLEIASTVAWSAYFSELLGVPDTSLINLADRLYDSYDEGVNYWIKSETNDERNFSFRVAPWRKYAWEYVPSGSLSWVMTSLKQLSNDE